jgi:hypothetical protein
MTKPRAKMTTMKTAGVMPTVALAPAAGSDRMSVATAATANITYITLRAPFLSETTPPNARKMLPGME